jgi:hypothetical protein
MTTLHVPTVFMVLGPLFLLLGLATLVRQKSISAQARTWLLLGLIFSATAAWLHWNAEALPPERATTIPGPRGPVQASWAWALGEWPVEARRAPAPGFEPASG